jgi:hypothetical protein
MILGGKMEKDGFSTYFRAELCIFLELSENDREKGSETVQLPSAVTEETR